METALFSPSSLFGNTSDNSSDEEPNTQQNFVERTHQFPGMELIVREFSFHQLNGNLLWPGTFAFSECLVQNRSMIEGRHVIELGSGTGALAIFLKKLLQIDVTTSDYDDQEIEDNITYNCKINRVVPALPHVKHTWGDAFSNGNSNWDLIIASDILLCSKNCFSWMGPVPTILITQSEQIKDGFNRMNEFRKPKLNPLIQTFSTGLVNYEGHQWAKHRKILNPAFHLDKLKLMLPAFETSVIETLNNWEKIVSKTGSSELDVWPHFTKLTADAISRAAFGSSFDDGRRIFELLTEQKELIIRLIKYSYIPGWKYIPTKGKKRMDEMNAEIKTLLKTVINTRKNAMEAGELAKDDLLGILLDSNSKEAKQLSERESETSSKKRLDLAMSFQEVIDECKLFFLAGQETTSVLLAWTVTLLGKHQEWQTRAREEVLATFGMKRPDFDGLNSRLKIVTMILYEVLRLYPSIVATSRKVYDCETKLGDLVIPPGVAISFSILHAHLDPEVWGNDVKEFKPDRFSEGISKATKGINSYFPFGWGPRICIGQSFALIEAKMALSMILQRFSFEISPSYTHAPSTFIALQPQHGVPVILHKL